MAQLSTRLPLELMLTRWAAVLNPLLALPILQGNLIANIALTASTAQAINHLLARPPIGWFLTDNTASATVWRTTPFNKSTITLEASANTTISFWVF